MSNTGKRVGSAPQKCAKMACNAVLLVFTFVAWCIEWLHSPTVIRGKKTHIGHFYTLLILHSVSGTSATTAWHHLHLGVNEPKCCSLFNKLFSWTCKWQCVRGSNLLEIHLLATPKKIAHTVHSVHPALPPNCPNSSSAHAVTDV